MFILTQRATNKAKPSNTIFDRMVNQLSSAAHQASHPSSSSSTSAQHLQPAAEQADKSRLDRLMKFSGLSNIAHNTSSTDKHGAGGGAGAGEVDPAMLFEDGDGELSVEVAERMLEWHAEALGRMVELSPAGDVCVLSSRSLGLVLRLPFTH